MKTLLAVVGLLALIALIVGGSYVSSRNEMVRKNEAVKQAWAQVDVVLQRRADLIPNLVATVKGYAAQEVKVFGDVDNARAALLSARTPADRIAANGQLDGAACGSLVVSGHVGVCVRSERIFPGAQAHGCKCQGCLVGHAAQLRCRRGGWRIPVARVRQSHGAS